MNLEDLKKDCQIRQKKGIHFILASVIIWIALYIVQSLNIDQLTKNLITFCCTSLLLPLSFFISKILKIDFQGKGNPLTNLGIVFSLNQILYMLIAMWIYPTIPDKMLMVLAMIFGAHLLPYGWLYDSKSYYVFSVLIPIISLIVGLKKGPNILAFVMIILEILFSISLFIENNKNK